MNSLFNRVTLLVCSCALVALGRISIFSVVAFLAAVTVSALNYYFSNRYFKIAAIGVFTIASFYFTDFFFYYPLVYYDAFSKSGIGLFFLAGTALVVNLKSLPFNIGLILIILFGLSGLLRRNEELVNRLNRDYRTLRDTTRENAMLLESKNKDLMEKQDYEINLATLNERNRIAREIHDNVGHLLSRSILQVGALMAIHPEAPLQENLVEIKDTLSQAMDSIRDSVHNLHDESIDCQTQICSLIDDFDFCEVSLDYGIEGNPSKEQRYAFITIVKEALSNVMRHSDASRVKVSLREHPALYQLIIEDNGTTMASGHSGIGLQNIADRVEALNGNLNIRRERGFHIFISIPKEEHHESNRH